MNAKKTQLFVRGLLRHLPIVLLLSLMMTNARAYQPQDWMSEIKDQTKLGQLAIPGTHDSGAYAMFPNIGETQDWNISEQLNNGIRFLDIRIANRLFSVNDFEIRHELLMLGSFNDRVMSKVNGFLTSHPQETILMSIRDEDTLDIVRLERDYIYAANSKFYQGAVDGDTLLEDVRGKIVLFNRYNSGTGVGINWGDNQLHIQDEYNLDVNCKEILWQTSCLFIYGLDYAKKAEKVVEHLNDAESRDSDSELWINFTSANYLSAYIGNNASYVNQETKDHFDQACCFRAIGSIVIMDYPNRTTDVIDSIIQNALNAHEKGVSQSSMIPGGNYDTEETDGFWGTWGNIATCPANQYVYGYRLRSENSQGSGDDTALNDIELRCATKGSGGSYTTIYSKYATRGTFGNHVYCAGSDNPVIGFDMKIEAKQGGGDNDDSAANDVDLYCQNGGYISAPVNTSWGNWTAAYKCPIGQAVTGIVTRVEDSQGDGDDSALNGVRLICADY